MFTLTQQEDRLCLIDPDNPSIKPIYVDFNAPTLNYRRHQGGSEAIVKAIKDFPGVNVSVSGNNIIKRKNINIGMANPTIYI